MVTFRPAIRDDVPTIVAMLQDDSLGKDREIDDLAIYFAAFDQMQTEQANMIIVGEENGTIIATYQLVFISGLSLRASKRAQIESVRVASHLRGQGIGGQLMADAETRARDAGCSLFQLTTNKTRDKARAFYDRLGFTPSHIGFKRNLSDLKER
ncbi:GNAT family N-acetyltransferase [Parasulfitobacter algicola]|uniref:GNAT family N-acetyltransferase n=1 Tax=Parasulfitobacter algicola TaxID=2614809 RepID=A0ABX2IWJ5_9RHOB|nr:GNAT family N-acetyltransferase [Sulfitobacter algicola]